MEIRHHGKLVGKATSVEFRDAEGNRIDLEPERSFRLPKQRRLRLEMDGASYITMLKLWAELLDR